MIEQEHEHEWNPKYPELDGMIREQREQRREKYPFLQEDKL